jgi:glycine betaine/proline transport system ATP-binding protein
MREQGVSSVYVVDDDMRLVGILTLEQALKVRAGVIQFSESITKDLPTTSKTTQIADLLPIAASAQYPIAVVDDKNILTGIVTKAAVLSSLV